MSNVLAPHRKLKLWEALGLSVALMAPTLAMTLNGIGVVNLVGKSTPLVFAMGFLGVLLVAYGFVRLTSYFNHAGSVYALAGVTMGPRAGFFGGFALVATYVLFAASVHAAISVFLEAFIRDLGIGFDISWMLIAVVTGAVTVFLATRTSTVTARTLVVIEGIGILCMLVLALVIVVRAGTGNSPDGQTLDFSSFTPSENNLNILMTATVFAFLSWAGFEACASLGEETDDPQRNIPRALMGSLIITGVVYVFVMFAQTVGFGTNEAGVASFGGSQSSLLDLGEQYLGVAFSLVLSFTLVMSAVASGLGSTMAGSRLMFALARDGFGPRALASTNASTGSPVVAVMTVTIAQLAICFVLWSRGSAAFDVYFWTATIGVLCLMIVYGVAAAGVIVFTLRGTARIPKWEIIIPTLGIAYLVFVIYKQSVGQAAPYDRFPYIAAGWCLVGFVITLVAPKLTERIGQRLSGELAATGSVEQVSRERRDG